MKTRNFLFSLLAVVLTLCPLSAFAAFDASGSVYTMRGTDGLDENVLVDGKITFVSQTGSAIPGYKDTGINFLPAAEGNVLKISVDFIDLSGDNYLLLYETPIAQVKSGTSDGKGQSSYLPSGWLNKLTAADSGFTYQSTAANGGLSFGFHSGTAGGQKGFTITIESVALKDMEYVGASAATDLKTPYRGEKDATIAALCITTDGGLNPLQLNALSLDCSALAALPGQLSAIRLYRSKDLTESNLLASLDASGALTAADLTLKSGRNLFYIVADIATDAVGQLPDIRMASLSVGGTDRTADAPALTPSPVANEIRFAATPATYTITDPALFFDDGGKEGKVGNKFEGSITFVPSTPGNAVKVDVTNLKIFNTSNTGYNDTFSFYNGREATEANLITTLLKKPRIVKSTASDGSMTVTFKSITGVPADGFEATVSEYTPGNMTITSVDAAPCGDAATVSAMQKGVEMLTFDILTDNVANPLKLESIALSTTRPEAFAALDVYATDSSTENPVEVKVASFAPTDAAFTIPAERVLAEGHNRFTVRADFAEGLLNGEAVDLSMSAVTVSGTAREAKAEKRMDVDNVWKSTEGKNTVNVNGSWKFTETSYEGSATRKYAAGQIDQITTFRPVNAGHVMQLDFDFFTVYYASYSSGTRATFEIYNGSECTSDALLWKVDNSTKATSGPGESIRSTAADGSLTIRFNPNATASYYLGGGWDAVLTEYRNHDMQITDASASIPTTSEMAVGATDQPLLDFALTTEGTLTVKKLSKINLSVANPEALAALAIYVSINADGKDAALFGRSETPAAVTTVAGEYELREGTNYFFVKADVANDAVPETVVAAGLLSAEDTAGNVDEFAGCTPEGGRTVKDMIVAEAGVHTAVIAGNKMFYDDGGKDGPITRNIKSTYTFTPDREGYAVTVDTRYFAMGNGRIYVYSGPEAADDRLLGSPTGYSGTTGPKELVSKSADGSLTIAISGPTSALGGFAFELGLHERVPYALASAEAASAVPSAETVRGSSDVPLLRVKTIVEGDKDDSDISDLTFSLAGTTDIADIKALKLYYTGTDETFTPSKAELLAAIENPSEATATFNAVKTTGDSGIFHFYLAADLKSDAQSGHVVKAAFNTLAFNGTTSQAAPSSTTAETTLAEGVKGTFTIGSSAAADFASFKEAVASLEKGLEGPVAFEIENGTYAENLVIENVSGTSAVNTLTFRSKSGSRSDVIVKGSYSNAEKDGIVRIVATPFVAIENLSVEAGNASFDNAIYVAKGSYNTTLANLEVTADKVTSGYTGINLLRTYASTSEAGQYNDNLTVRDCRFAGGRIGLYLASNGIVARQQDRNYRIIHNVLEGIGSKAVYASDIRELTLSDNTILEPEPVKNYYATDIYRVKGATIAGNRIVNGSEGNTKDTNGLYFRTGCGPDGDKPFRVFNNEVVYISSPSFGSRCIQLSNDCHDMEIAYNTFRATGQAVYLLATSGSFTAKGNKVIGNIFHTECTNSASYPLYFWNTTDIDGFEIAGNAFYSANGMICKNDGTVLDAEGFNALAGNTTNIYEQSRFISITDSHLAEPGSLRCGTPLAYVATDRDGNLRDAAAPTLGAYEYAVQSADAPAMLEGYPRVATPTENSASVATKWNMGATLYAVALEATADKTPTLEQLKAAKGVEISAEAEYSWKFTGLAPSTDYRAWFVAVSALGTESEIIASDVFTTARHIEPLSVAFANDVVSVNYGQSATLEAFVSGGDLPYSYEWKGNDGALISTEQTITVTPETPGFYTLTVASADGQKASARMALEPVGGPLVVATAEEFPLDEDTHFTPMDDGLFYSGSFAFHYGGMPEYDFWYGFAPSNETSAEYTGLTDQFRSASGGGYGSENFVVGYPQGQTIEPVGFKDGVVIPGFYVNNSAMAYASMKTGDSFAKKFETGDWFKLTARITGTDGSSYDTDLFYLADFRDSNPAEHYIINDWEYVDLSRFGKIKDITFLFDSSDKGTYGINTPSYLCIDNFGCQPDAIRKSLTVSRDGLDLAPHFEIDPDGTRTQYSLVQTSGEETMKVRLEDGRLYLDEVGGAARSASPVEVLVSMLQKGHTQRLALSLTKDVETGVGTREADGGFDVVLTGETLTIRCDAADYTLDIYTADGMLLHHAAGLEGDFEINRDALTTGVHIIRIKTAEGEFARKLFIR